MDHGGAHGPYSVSAADADTLGGLFATAPTFSRAPSAYDPVSDRLYARTADGDRLTVIDAAALGPAPVPTDAPVVGTRPSAFEAWRAGAETVGEPVIVMGHARVTATPPGEGDVGLPALSRDGGRSWVIASRPWAYSDPHCLVASPAFERDQTLYRCTDGVSRSQDGGRTWQPANTGLQARSVRGLAISPGFERDRTLFATSFTSPVATPPAVAASPVWFRPPAGPEDAPSAWRSSDGGGTWVALGPFAALALSPDFEQDRTVFAFDHLGARAYASADGGTTWQARGRLPEIGREAFQASVTWIIPPTAEQKRVLLTLATSGTGVGGAVHWPESGARLFRSLDDGATWDVAWQAAESREFFAALDGVLLGPVAADKAGDGSAWLLHLDAWPDAGTLLSWDGGVHWSAYHLPGATPVVPLTAWPDGRILVSVGQGRTQRTVAVEDFEHGPPPTPAPSHAP